MRKSLLILALGALCAAAGGPPATAGGLLEGVVITGPGPVPGTLVREFVTLRWDDRCLPVHFTFNTIVLPDTEPLLDSAAMAAVLQKAFDAWNDIPTSYIEMRITGQRQRAGPPKVFDFVNEINFLFGAGDTVAGASPTALPVDFEAVPGLDADFDGDVDVFDPAVVGLNHCADVDGDGDIEFPAGFYLAGTILEVDISFNQELVWTTGPPDASFGTIDLEGAAVHEIGHAFGLAHSLINQLAAGDGTGASMWAPLDRDDPADKLSLRSLEVDDIAWASFLYPEGSATSGPAALGPGDVAFDQVFGIVRGEVTHGRTGLPLVGASIQAIDRDTGEVVVSHNTGRGRWLLDPVSGLHFVDPELADFHLIDGAYRLPLPPGEYHLVIEAMDGAPTAAAEFMRETSAQVGNALGLLDFNEEFLLKNDSDSDSDGDSDSDSDGDSEHEPLEVEVEAGEIVEVDHTTSVDHNLDPFDLVGNRLPGRWDVDVFGAGLPPNTILAVRIPAAEMAAFLADGVPKAMAYRTAVEDRSVAPVFARAALVIGRVEGAAAIIDLEDPLVEEADFLGQDDDFAPLFFAEPGDLAEMLHEAIDEDGASDFFMVLEWPEIGQGVSGMTPLVGLDIGQEAGLLGRSFVSFDGGASFVQVPEVNFMFRMIFGPSS